MKDLNVMNEKLREYYAKTQDALSFLYEKATLLSSIKKNIIFHDNN
jgi:hypothetical protein